MQYLILILTIRAFHSYGREYPLNAIFLFASIFSLCSLTVFASVGFADIISSGLVPVTLGSLFLSYILICYLLAPKLVQVDEDAPARDYLSQFRIDIMKPTVYYTVPPLVGISTLISWPIVFGTLRIFDSVAGNENAAESLLWEGAPGMIIAGSVLMVSHLKIYRM